MERRIRVLSMLGALLIALAACGPQVETTPATLLSGEALAPVDPATVKGEFEVTGSSTVYPLTARMAEEFAADGSRAQIDIRVTGSGGGFRSFCGGDPVDMVNASRPINENEITACRAVGRDPIGFQVGVDALAIVVSNQNTFVRSLTFEQLAQIFSGQAQRWSEVDPGFPAEPINIFSPGVDSGTFDYFVEEVLDGDETLLPAIPGAVLSEDDIELQRGIENNPYAIGYFGFAYFQTDVRLLRALPIDDGSGPVQPGEASVADGTYPLARPLFIYTSRETIEQNPAVAAFISYYLQHVNEVIAEVGYFPMPDIALAEVQQELVGVLR